MSMAFEERKQRDAGLTLLTLNGGKRNRDFPLSLPGGFAGRLGRLEDRSGTGPGGVRLRVGLPLERAREWRCGEPPTAFELRSMTEWACSVFGAVALLLMDCSCRWPYRGTG